MTRTEMLMAVALGGLCERALAVDGDPTILSVDLDMFTEKGDWCMTLDAEYQTLSIDRKINNIPYPALYVDISVLPIEVAIEQFAKFMDGAAIRELIDA